MIGQCSEAAISEIRFDHVCDLGMEITQAFLQDRDGFLWIGTLSGGLFKYDGYQWKNYGIGAGKLNNGHVIKIVEDGENSDILWIVTLGSGITRFNKATETFTHYTRRALPHNGLASDFVADLIQDREDPHLLWIIGSDGFLQKFDKHTGRFTLVVTNEHPDVPGNMEFFNLIQDRQHPHVLWITGRGLIRFDTQQTSLTCYQYDEHDPLGLGFPTNYIGAIAQDKDDQNILWLGYWDGAILAKFDTQTETFTHYRHQPDAPHSLRDGAIQLIYDDGGGTLWLGGWANNNGLTAFDKRTGTATSFTHSPADASSVSTDTVVNVYKDMSGILWIIHLTGKIDKYDRRNQNFRLYQQNPYNANSLVNNSVYSIYEDRDHNLWFGTIKGLSKFERSTRTFTNYTYTPDELEGIDNDYILSTFEDSAGNFWVGAFASPLMRVDKATGRVLERIDIAAGSGVAEIIEDSEDPEVLWLGLVYQRGVTKFEKKTGTLTSYPRAVDVSNSDMLDEVTIILHDRFEDVLWFGAWSGGGFNKFDKQTETFTRYRANPDDPQGLSCDYLGEIYQDAAGILWIGTLGGGLNAFDPHTDTFRVYGSSHEVPSVVNSVIEDDQGYLWLSTNQGIMRFDPRAETIDRVYTVHDGLQGNAFLYESGLKTRSGQIWFGGTNGVNSFDPDALSTNTYVPPVVLTSLTQGGEEVDWNRRRVASRLTHITLNWKRNFFEFQYAALNYTIPEKNQYKYMLEGLDTDWYFAGTQRSGRYAGIPPGNYTLRIIGSNNDGVWNTDGVALAVTVVPPFWKTRWFYLAVLLSVFLLFFAVFYVRTKQLQHFNATLKLRLDERTQQLEAANAEIVALEKEHLERQMAGGFAHEMRNALVGVVIGLQLVMDDDATLCQKNSELLGDIFDRLEPVLSAELRQEVIQSFATIDQHEETLDAVLKKTHECITHALDVTKIILDYSRLGRTEAGREAINIQEIVTRIHGEHVQQFAQQGVTLHVAGTVTHTLPAHPAHIHSMLNNLVLNARDALLEVTDDRQRQIDIIMQEDTDRVVVRVRDNADGIAQENLDKIFDPFFSTKPSTGTGLGLNYVSKLVSLYRGAIQASSTPGKGTTFTLALPLTEKKIDAIRIKS